MAKINLIPDKPNCTYWWMIKLNSLHPDNSPNVKEIHGYSKFQNHAEAKDKNNVLMAKIEMLYKNGYFGRASYIEIYKRLAPLPNKHEDIHILTLYQKDFMIPPEILPNAPRIVMEYLKKFYDAIAHGKRIEFLRPLPAAATNKNDTFNINNYNFTKYSELYAFAEKKIADGESPQECNNFIRKYADKNFTNFNNLSINSLAQNLTAKFGKK